MPALKGGMSYNEKIILNNQALGELTWWIENLKYFNGRYLIQAKTQIQGWGANCIGMETGGKSHFHRNISKCDSPSNLIVLLSVSVVLYVMSIVLLAYFRGF